MEVSLVHESESPVLELFQCLVLCVCSGAGGEEGGGVAALARESLHAHGYATLEASSVSDALKYLRAYPVRAVVSELRLASDADHHSQLHILPSPCRIHPSLG